MTRWGVIGTGGIAAKFVTDLRLLPDAEVVAVGSRSQGTADAFGDEFDVARRHPSYQSLVDDPDVDVVYVATPHPVHFPAAMLAIEAGKPVLVEKPFTLNATEAAELIAAARRRGVFLMEAMWTRFLPHMVRIRELLAGNTLGDIRTVQADHGQWFRHDPTHRLLNPAMGGGALLDLGVYPVSFASMVLGAPAKVTAVSTPAETGVDAQTSMVLEHPGGAHAVLTTTLAARTPNRAAIAGTLARIEVDPVWYSPTDFTVVALDGTELERYVDEGESNGLRHQAAEVARCLSGGRLESAVMPLDESLSVMRTLDEARRQIGLVYPSERS